MTSRILGCVMFAMAFAMVADQSFAQEVPKNHEKLNEHLGWLIGEWSAEITTADNQVEKVLAKYRWVAHKQVIRLDLSIGDWEGPFALPAAKAWLSRVLGRIGSRWRIILRISSRPDFISSLVSKGVVPVNSS